ncbi:MAG: 16S rRNA (cytidine(1402)-2'-O)-methyltransferase [Deferribacteraceae bacterium]|jgi:16S rRNA (cytidine1402-2'-O)-methyltransferase|nr:16S rRNA (cytidine(1402)-2'-O)-methyltransferase [Deferribacteraceae bacterium]
MSHTPEARGYCRLVGTPIGNLSDFTPRGLSAIREADIIFAEDTRTAKALLHHFEISKPIESYHKDNEQTAVYSVLSQIKAGKRVALISEAGMPCVSDPGFLLVRTLMEQGIPFEVVSGVSAAVHASAASGLCESGQYLFAGFLPHKGAERALERFISIPFPIVFYESPYRVKDTVELLLKHFPAPIAVCRELTKLHEEIVWVHSMEEFDKVTIRGEFCLVVNNSKATEAAHTTAIDAEKIAKILIDSDVPNKTIVETLKAIGVKRNEAYEIVERIKISC